MNLAVRILYGMNREFPGLDWKEFAIKENASEIAKQCAEYEVVAFSCYIWNITQTLKVARLLKEINPSIQILLGGPEVSYDWQDVIKKEEVDFIITGEGEIPFREFLHHYPKVSDIGNLVYKEQGQVKFTPSAESFNLLELEGFNPYVFEPTQEIKTKVSYMETSRGCPYKCEFCLASLDNKVRYLPLATIKENLLFLMEHGKVIKFLDRTFNVKKDFTLDIFQFILDHHKPGNVFQFEITADIVHPDIVAFIKEKVPKGLFRFEIGIQTVNQKANLEVSRKQNFEKTKAVILQLQPYVEMHLDLIVGLPLDYFSDIQHSFEEVFAIHPPELQLGFLKFLKGTPVREKYEQYGFRFDPNPPYQIIESNYLSKEELHQITLLEEALELYWNKGRAIHTLLYAEKKMGIFKFLTELGAWFSAHSDFHKHSLEDSFNLLHSFCLQSFPADPIIEQLIAIDYYLHFKVKPKTMFLEEIDRTNKSLGISQLKLNHHLFRFIALPLTFNFSHYQTNGSIRLDPSILFVQYSGTNKATIAGELAQTELAVV
jgi:radical SAM superfamily enzyme YgiQ (UPF0313 family)